MAEELCWECILDLSNRLMLRILNYVKIYWMNKLFNRTWGKYNKIRRRRTVIRRSKTRGVALRIVEAKAKKRWKEAIVGNSNWRKEIRACIWSKLSWLIKFVRHNSNSKILCRAFSKTSDYSAQLWPSHRCVPWNEFNAIFRWLSLNCSSGDYY